MEINIESHLSTDVQARDGTIPLEFKHLPSFCRKMIFEAYFQIGLFPSPF